MDVDYRFLEKEENLVVSATKNISASGVCIFLKDRLAPSSVLELSFSLPSGQNLFKVKGKVVWVQEFQMGKEVGFEAGIEFFDLDAQAQHLINSYVLDRLKT